MTDLPDKEQILRWIADNPDKAGKREIARAFGVKGAARVELNRMLAELRAEGRIPRRSRTVSEGARLPPVAVLAVEGPDAAGDLIARPLEWRGEGAAPRVLLLPGKGAAPGAGDRVLARLTARPVADEGDEPAWEGRVIRVIGRGPRRILGLYREGAEGGRILPIDKGASREWVVARRDVDGAKDGELVEAEQTAPAGRLGLPRARIVEVLGNPMAPKAVSLYAIHQYGIPDAFPEPVLAEAEAIAMLDETPEERTDLTDLPFVTIDPADARDHDDAVCAMPDDDRTNPGGHIVWVAIADVAHYVRSGSALDAEAWRRGNSTYFPDRVVPMLPDRLSGDLCSLHEGVLRPVIAVRMRLSEGGRLLGQSFHRAMIRSRASLTYSRVQAAADGRPDAATAPLLQDVIRPLYAAYGAAARAREQRQPLHLDLPERRIELSDDGHVTAVTVKERLEAHRLIEEFMILANVSAARVLARRRVPFLYRVHEEPSPEKLDALRDIAHAAGLTLAKGQVLKTRHLNRLLDAAAGTENAEIIAMAVLRSMPQAYYSVQNFGHFGLNLKAYAHFTSPIRRYADLTLHRALITAHKWGDDGLSPQDVERLEETAEMISQAERRSMAAERDTADRYLAAWLSERVGTAFSGRISGIARFGLFVRLDETGADGLVPISTLGHEYFRFDAHEQTLRGERSGLVLKLGMPVMVRLAEAVPVTGGLMFELLEAGGRPLPRPQKGAGRPVARKLNAARRKARRARRRRKG